MGFLLEVAGPLACFSRPELKVEMVSYDVITPTAARAILEAIYWKPEIRWEIDGIHILKPIQTISLKRNFVFEKLKNPPININKERDQRHATILRDVAYIIEAHFKILSGDDNSSKHSQMFTRRAQNGQCFSRPYFGCREFSVEKFRLLSNIKPSLKGIHNLGYMLHSIDYETGRPAFFNAVLKEGYLKVPPIGHPEVKQ
jgi:CRISPR-associated protein Cas5d